MVKYVSKGEKTDFQNKHSILPDGTRTPNAGVGITFRNERRSSLPLKDISPWQKELKGK